MDHQVSCLWGSSVVALTGLLMGCICDFLNESTFFSLFGNVVNLIIGYLTMASKIYTNKLHNETTLNLTFLHDKKLIRVFLLN